MQSHIFFCCRLRLHFVYFEFILFVDIDGVSCTLKCHLFCSSQERARTVSRKQVNSKWTLQFENVSKNHKQFSNIFTKCLQASCMTSSDNMQPAKSGWYTCFMVNSQPSSCSDLLNRWLDAIQYLIHPFRCRLRLSAIDIHRRNINVDI